jgi:hypothetical protein
LPTPLIVRTIFSCTAAVGRRDGIIEHVCEFLSHVGGPQKHTHTQSSWEQKHTHTQSSWEVGYSMPNANERTYLNSGKEDKVFS